MPPTAFTFPFAALMPDAPEPASTDVLLVTGCAGFIGSRLAAQLVERGHTVVGVDRRPYDGVPLARFVHGDLTDARVRAEALDGVSTVYHLAAAKSDWGQSDDEYERDNVVVTRELLADGLARGIRRWLFYSSVSTFGPSDVPLDETAPLRPNLTYGRSKVAGEGFFRSAAAADPALEVAIVRPSVVFGAGHPDNTNISRLVESVRRRRFLMIGPGTALKTTSYVENLLAATHFMAARLRPGVETFVYVDMPVRSTRALVNDVYRLLGKRAPTWHLPLGPIAAVARVFDWAATLTGIDLPITSARIRKFNTSTAYDASAIRRAGFVPPIEIEEALGRTVAWHLDRARSA